MNLSNERRACLAEMRALTVDKDGTERLVGLTREESEFYLNYGEKRIAGRGRDSTERSRYLALHSKHEQARLSVIAAEIQLRTDQPPLQ